MNNLLALGFLIDLHGNFLCNGFDKQRRKFLKIGILNEMPKTFVSMGSKFVGALGLFLVPFKILLPPTTALYVEPDVFYI